MKKVFLMALFFLVSFSHSAFALDWAYPFVVWKGKMYEVTDEEVQEIGEQIGKVRRKANETTGKYFGDASNALPKGTKYYEIKGISTNEAIAVEIKPDKWMKANYIGKSHGEFSLDPNGMILLLGMIMFTVVMVIVLVGKKRRIKG